jgi:hypothetical protein
MCDVMLAGRSSSLAMFSHLFRSPILGWSLVILPANSTKVGPMRRLWYPPVVQFAVADRA